MENVVLTVAVAVITSTALSAIVVACLNRKWAKEDRELVTKDDLQSIHQHLNDLRSNQKIVAVDRIRHLIKTHIEVGHIELDDKETIMEMFQSYKSLGGNGHLDIVMSELEKIPVMK